MPDAKSLLPGRAFRSEHAQLRPEPHSIASHGPAPMDPLQTTRMRNGVLYAAEWPCCHDPLRLSLGSEDPFYNSQPTRSARAVAHTPTRVGAPAARAECVRLPRARGGVRPTQIPSPPSQQPLPPRARSAAHARGLPRRQARKCVLPPTPQPSRPPYLPNLSDVSFASIPPA